jgi:hypothetical protein
MILKLTISVKVEWIDSTFPGGLIFKAIRSVNNCKVLKIFHIIDKVPLKRRLKVALSKNYEKR